MTSKEISIKGNDKLHINTFTFDMLVKNAAIVMIAKRGSGKSWVVRALLQFFKDIPVGLIISPTDKLSKFYSTFIPESYIHYQYKSEIIKSVMARQTEIKRKFYEKKEQGKKLDPRAYIVMDDCLGQKGSWMRDEAIMELLFNGRHYELMYVLTMQFPLGITPELRSNFDYVFLLADDIISNQKRMYDHYAGIFPTFDSFRQIFTQLTADFGSMVLVNRGCKGSIFEKVFYYKSPDLENISVRMGCRQFQSYHKNNFNRDWQKKATEFNINDFIAQKKRDKSAIVVDKTEPKKSKKSSIHSF
jgi:hypothetical protein